MIIIWQIHWQANLPSPEGVCVSKKEIINKTNKIIPKRKKNRTCIKTKDISIEKRDWFDFWKRNTQRVYWLAWLSEKKRERESSFNSVRLGMKSNKGEPSKTLTDLLLKASAQGNAAKLADLLLTLQHLDLSSVRNDKGRTPLHLICLNGNELCLDMILRNTKMVNFSYPIQQPKWNGFSLFALYSFRLMPRIPSARRHLPKLLSVASTILSASLLPLVPMLKPETKMQTRNAELLDPPPPKGILQQLLKDVVDHRPLTVAVSPSSRPLHQAAYHGHASTIEKLLSFGSAINVKNETDSTPLHFAAVSALPTFSLRFLTRCLLSVCISILSFFLFFSNRTLIACNFYSS